MLLFALPGIAGMAGTPTTTLGGHASQVHKVSLQHMTVPISPARWSVWARTSEGKGVRH